MKTPTHLATLILTLALASVRAETAAPLPGSLLPGDAVRWQLLWNDEFEDADEKLDTRWNAQNGPSNHILCSRWRENVAVLDGTLRLQNRKESRGGQDWTSGSIRTREHFLYGYFECRYRYAAAAGTNNAFWIMTQGAAPAGMKRFEIDINEGHYPAEINTNIHNWTDIITDNGKKRHPTDPMSFTFGLRPDVSILADQPVKTRRIRLTSDHPTYFHLRGFRILAPTTDGYPEIFSKDTALEKKEPENLATKARIRASGFFNNGKDNTANLIDGNMKTSWVSQTEGAKWVEFEFPEDIELGCIQFINGWLSGTTWKGLVSNYRVEFHDGTNWKSLASYDANDGTHDFSRDFQTFGLEWSKDSLVFYHNGREIRRQPNTFCHSPAPVCLSAAITPWAGPTTDAISGTFMEVDFVRIYQKK